MPNPKKVVFGSDTVEFACFVITPTDIQPSDKHIRAIRDFRTPQNTTDIRSWFGLINQESYCNSLRYNVAPFREHLKQGSTIYWDDLLQQFFEQSWAAMLQKNHPGCPDILLQTYNMSRHRLVQERHRFRALAEVQNCTSEVNTPIYCSRGWKIVFAGSRFCPTRIKICSD